MPGYLSTELHFSKLDSYAITTAGLLGIAVLVPFMGYLSDCFGRKPLMLAGCAGFILFSYPTMMVMAQGNFLSAVLAMLLLGAFIAAFDGACSAAMAELFPTSVRYGGLSIAYNFAVAFFVRAGICRSDGALLAGTERRDRLRLAHGYPLILVAC